MLAARQDSTESPTRRQRLQQAAISLTKVKAHGTTDPMHSSKTFDAGTDPEVVSVKQLLKLLDKSAKSARTYGAKNPVAERFFRQFYDELTKHLEQYGQLAFLIQRNQLFFKDEVVYQPESEATGDSIAFKMYADGIRELSFHQGLSREDLSFFLEALWGTGSGDAAGDKPSVEDDDDDIVTRLWAKNLSTIALVTAEELVRSSGFGPDVLELQTQGYMNQSVTSLRDILDRERAATAGGGDGGTARTESDASQRFQLHVVGYEVSQQELEALTKEIAAETRRDGMAYILDVLTAVLASEPSHALLSKLFDVWEQVLDVLIRNGQWTVLETVLTLLQDIEAVRKDLSESHKQQVAGLFDGLNRPERVKAIGLHLNRNQDAKTEGLLTLLLMMKKEAVPALCSLLAGLEVPAHQGIVMEALQVLGPEHPESILRGLTDKRPMYVRNLLTLLARWNNPQFADQIEKALRHPDATVRRDVLRLLASLRPSGPGNRLISLLLDQDETVRLTAMKLLATGHYQASFQHWSPFLTQDGFLDRSPAEKRAIYLAMKQTVGDEAVPYWQGLLTEWSWTNRKKKEELALLAADMLGKLATSAAHAALELGQKKGGAAVRQACGNALAAITRLQRQHIPPAANG